MRFIHAADIHLGSKLSGKLPEAKSRIRKDELRASFSRLVEYTKQQEIKAILLSGDVFDDDAPKSKDVRYFYSVVDAHPGIDFYYLRGNHDRSGALAEERPNLHRFGENWTSYELEPGVILTGIEFSQENSLSLYATLQLDPKAKNVVTLHGQVSSSTGPYEINLPKLRDKHIDYLALGHVHKKEVGKLDLRGTYAYPGCLEGRGYDEIGEKGFFLVDTDLPFDKGGLTFVPFASRAIRLLEVDISDCKDSYEAIQKIRKARSWKKEDLLRIEISGEKAWQDDSLAHQVELALEEDAFFVFAKDRTVPKIDISTYLDSPTLRGEFVRRVLASSHDEETKKRIIRAGLSALNGEEVHG